MTTSTQPSDAVLAPNHHADHPGFAGITGLIAAVTFSIGRDGDADLALHLTDVGPDDHVVDVGCGPGVAVRRAASGGAASVVGVDPAPVMLRVARAFTRTSRWSGSTVRFTRGAAEALPLPDDSATVVWSLATVHHWRDLDAGLEEAKRVLRARGRLLAVERHIRPEASGHASHGWTAHQAEHFAERCRALGFADVEIGHHRAGRKHVLSVLATTGPGG